MSRLLFKVIEDPAEAKVFWDLFSPKKTIDDEWDFRDIWTKSYNFPFHFIVEFDGEKPVGLLPLQRNTLKGLSPKLLAMDVPFLEFFAGLDTDNNRVFINKEYENCIPQFLQEIKEPTVLSSLKEPCLVDGKEAEHYLYRYELDLVKLPTFESFMQTNLDGVSRQRLINRLNKIDKTYKAEIRDGGKEDLERMFQLSIERFGERSSFNMPDRQQIYRELLERFDVDLMTIVLDNEVKAVSFAIVHNGTYTTINVGYDYDVRDLSKLLVVTQIKRAMDKKSTVFDAGQGDNGWKEHFNLTKIPQYKLVLNYTPKETI
jgi:hypothetical protein